VRRSSSLRNAILSNTAAPGAMVSSNYDFYIRYMLSGGFNPTKLSESEVSIRNGVERRRSLPKSRLNSGGGCFSRLKCLTARAFPTAPAGHALPGRE
jgi:hypothetical protein